MSALEVDARSVILAIVNDLQDRYKSIFSILKELIQNADDAKATRLAVGLHEGIADAANPLLRGPGLLVINDGEYEKRHEVGIRSASASSKTTENGSAGRFGLGQKAVFHLCDAFVVVPTGYGAELQPFVVNPYLGIETTHGTTEAWEAIGSDVGRLRAQVDTTAFPRRSLALWLPLRRGDLAPAPDLGFARAGFDDSAARGELADELCRPADLATILAAARHLDRIELRCGGASELTLARSGERLSLQAQTEAAAERTFEGAITLSTPSGTQKVRFAGIEVLSADETLTALKADTGWPTTLTLTNEKVREKALPHGAGLLLSGGPIAQGLALDWGVFLPIGERPAATVELARASALRLFLHGYFFVDSGRRAIQGMAADGADNDAPAGISLPARWNRRLRDCAVLASLPRLLHHALLTSVISADDLADLVRGLTRDPWFEGQRLSLGADCTLAQVWNGRASAWAVLDPTTALRPLPASLLDAPADLSALLPELGTFASRRRLSFCGADPDGRARVLAAEVPAWSPAELAALLDMVPPRALKQRKSATALADILDLAWPAGIDEDVGAVLRRKLREAMLSEGNFASIESMRRIVRHVPTGTIAFLPRDVAHSAVLGALASAAADAVVASDEWKDGEAPAMLRDRGVLAPLLRALEPLAAGEQDGDRAEQASRAAEKLIDASRLPLPSLAREPGLRDIRLFPATLMPGDERRMVSMSDLSQAAAERTLVLESPQIRTNAPALLKALPDLSLLMIPGNRKDLFESVTETEGQSRTLDVATMVRFVNAAFRFSEDAVVRDALVARIKERSSSDAAQVAALRRLLTGVAEAGSLKAKLYFGVAPGLSSLVERLLLGHASTFLVPDHLLRRLSRDEIDTLDLAHLHPPELERLLNEAHERGSFAASAEESLLLLESDLSLALLRRLPIYELESGDRVAITDTMCVATGRPVPRALSGILHRVRPAPGAKAHAVQLRLLPQHDAVTELQAALRGLRDGVLTPDVVRPVILDALADHDPAPLPPELRDGLRACAWLTIGGRAVAPASVLALPDAVGAAAALVMGRGSALAVHPAASLSGEVRGHRGFRRLGAEILPNETDSFAALAWQIAQGRLVGLPVVWSEADRRHLAILARAGADFAIPGWPLARALLCGDAAIETQSTPCLAEFAPARTAEDLSAVLTALAGIASRRDTCFEPARGLYVAAFKAGVGELDDAARRGVFATVLVPTLAGSWRPGRQVAARGDGLAPDCLLDPGLADILGRSGLPTAGEPGTAGASPDGPEAAPAGPDDLEARSAAGFERLLTDLKVRLPGDLNLTLLGLAGRFPAMRAAMARWHANASLGIDDHLADIDGCFAGCLSGTTLAEEIDGRRFLVERVAGDEVWAIALSGDRFDARRSSGFALLIGNGHETYRRARLPDGRGVNVHVLQVRASIPEAVEITDIIERVRDLVRTIADRCLHLFMPEQLRAVNSLRGMTGTLAQDLVDQTQAALREELPTVLKQFRLKTDPVLRPLIEEHDHASDRRRIRATGQGEGDRAAAERRLWDGLMDSREAQAALLRCVRRRVEDFGYDPGRVVFELFQNADDATRQRLPADGPTAFRLVDRPDGFDVFHWGRPINHRGPDREAGERLNYHRDLQNMLLMHVSDKPGGVETTGRYGLGFKSVHTLTGSVAVASDLLAARIVGGMLPEPWAKGPGEVARHERNGCPATLIRVPVDPDRAETGCKAVARFTACAPYLPLFAKAIRRIEVERHGLPGCEYERGLDRPVVGLDGIRLATVTGSCVFAALLLDLGEGFTLALKRDEIGPVAFDGALRLWWMAPLDAAVNAAWMLNGPFPLSPNRTALASGADEQAGLFNRLGDAFGRRLADLHRAASEDWPSLATALDLDPTESSQSAFFARLWEVLCHDLDDPLAVHLHGRNRGLGRLVQVAPVVPASPRAAGGRIRASEAVGVFGGALLDLALQDAMAEWDGLNDCRGRMVEDGTARALGRMGFDALPIVNAEAVLHRELAMHGDRVSPAMAARLGKVLSIEALDKHPLQSEGARLRACAKEARFQSRTGAWCRVADLTVPRFGTAGDVLRARFAPSERVLSDAYDEAGVAFVRLARLQSGYNPNGEMLRGWAEAATGDARQAVLRFLLEQDPEKDFLRAVLRLPPAWMQPLGDLADTSLTRDWAEDHRNELRARLTNFAPPMPAPPIVVEHPPSRRSTAEVLDWIWTWWAEDRSTQIPRYEEQVYPAGNRPVLPPSGNRTETGDREAWFTFLALACFQGFGGTQDVQHRTFIKRATAHGWWAELSRSPPDADPDVWLARLREWASDAQPDLDYWRWRRTLIDLYKIAQWLPQYAWIVTSLPRAIAGAPAPAVSLGDLLVPSFSPIWSPTGINAAPLVRTLGLGANWMVRELARTGFWRPQEAAVMEPYGWASTRRVRLLLNRLGADLGDRSSMDGSAAIRHFVSAHLPSRHAALMAADGDLPLQIVTRGAPVLELRSFCGDPPDGPGGPLGQGMDEDDADESDLHEAGPVKDAAE